MMPFTWSRGMLRVPLKFMCSTQCDTPVNPGPSSFAPTRYQHQTDANGAVWTSWMRTLSPLSSSVSLTDIRKSFMMIRESRVGSRASSVGCRASGVESRDSASTTTSDFRLPSPEYRVPLEVTVQYRDRYA